mgnify:CR=1 FL=1
MESASREHGGERSWEVRRTEGGLSVSCVGGSSSHPAVCSGCTQITLHAHTTNVPVVLLLFAAVVVQGRELHLGDLYDVLGQDRIIKISSRFYDRVYADPEDWFREIFTHSNNKERAIENQSEVCHTPLCTYFLPGFSEMMGGIGAVEMDWLCDCATVCDCVIVFDCVIV